MRERWENQWYSTRDNYEAGFAIVASGKASLTVDPTAKWGGHEPTLKHQ